MPNVRSGQPFVQEQTYESLTQQQMEEHLISEQPKGLMAGFWIVISFLFAFVALAVVFWSVLQIFN